MDKKAADITGLRSGKLVAVERTEKKKNGSILWRCRCDCGKEVLVPACAIRSGAIKSCGCSRRGQRAVDLTGRRFGRLTALRRLEEKSGSVYLWLCRCDCGKEIKVRANALTSGNTRSCGCANADARKKRARDISGQRFGKLTVIAPLAERRRRSVLWQCVCDCGKEAAYTYNELVYSGIRSCGCAQHPSRPLPLHYVEGTCLEMLEHKKLRRDNTSGCTGVVRTKRGWRAQIVFKKKAYYLGTFQDLQKAVFVRKQAESNLHGAFLDWYNEEVAAKNRRPRTGTPARLPAAPAERAASV